MPSSAASSTHHTPGDASVPKAKVFDKYTPPSSDTTVSSLHTDSTVIEKAPSKKKTSLPDVVDWASDIDPANPQNWAPSVKKQNLAVISAMAFVTYVSRYSPYAQIFVRLC